MLGTALGIKHAFRAMRPGGRRARAAPVINVASVAATIAFPGIAGYSATRSGRGTAHQGRSHGIRQAGYGVQVNCVYPGLVATEMGLKLASDMVTLGLFPSAESAVGGVIEQTPLGRLGEVPDMADVVVFLASDGARSITGAGLTVDGAWASDQVLLTFQRKAHS